MCMSSKVVPDPQIDHQAFATREIWLTIHSLRRIASGFTCIVYFPPAVHEVACRDSLRASRAGKNSAYYLGHLAESAISF